MVDIKKTVNKTNVLCYFCPIPLRGENEIKRLKINKVILLMCRGLKVSLNILVRSHTSH